MGDYFNSDAGGFVIVPIQIRADVRADVRIPKDLTEAEASKIAAVVKALANPSDTPRIEK